MLGFERLDLKALLMSVTTLVFITDAVTCIVAGKQQTGGQMTHPTPSSTGNLDIHFVVFQGILAQLP